MHILFVHQNYPAQFGHVARLLAGEHGCRCTFVSQLPAGVADGIRRVRYQPRGGATKANSYYTRSFENAVAHARGVFEACRRHVRTPPDLIVGHSGFGSTLFLRELYDCPIINYFEYAYRPHDSDMDFRPEFRASEDDILRSYCRNAMILLDLENCDAGYCPTRWQRGTLPTAYAPKVEVVFDGVDTSVWRRHEGLERRVADRAIGPDTRIVTYVARGFESMRGFDIFMKVARRIYMAMPDVLFVVVGEDRIAYGGDEKHTGSASFLEYALQQDDYDLSKFLFTGRVPPQQLARLLSLGDAHIYLTVPFVLSWSLFNSLACGATVVASRTGPVCEVVRHGENGLLADFYDVEGLADHALRVLRAPEEYRRLGREGRELIRREYAVEVTLPRMLSLFGRVVGRDLSGPPSAVARAPSTASRDHRLSEARAGN